MESLLERLEQEAATGRKDTVDLDSEVRQPPSVLKYLVQMRSRVNMKRSAAARPLDRTIDLRDREECIPKSGRIGLPLFMVIHSPILGPQVNGENRVTLYAKYLPIFNPLHSETCIFQYANLVRPYSVYTTLVDPYFSIHYPHRPILVSLCIAVLVSLVVVGARLHQIIDTEQSRYKVVHCRWLSGGG